MNRVVKAFVKKSVQVSVAKHAELMAEAQQNDLLKRLHSGLEEV